MLNLLKEGKLMRSNNFGGLEDSTLNCSKKGVRLIQLDYNLLYALNGRKDIGISFDRSSFANGLILLFPATVIVNNLIIESLNYLSTPQLYNPVILYTTWQVFWTISGASSIWSTITSSYVIIVPIS